MVLNLSSISSKLLLTTLFVSSTLGLTSVAGFAQSRPTRSADTTTFECVRLGSGFATIARRGNRTTSPMITWNSTAFGREFTPQRRCEIVSQRLTKAVTRSGGRLSRLRLTYGNLGTNPVICSINNQDEVCNSKNLLLTLNQADRGKEQEILTQMLSFSTKGTGSSLQRGRFFVNFGQAADDALKADTPTPTDTTPTPTTPSGGGF